MVIALLIYFLRNPEKAQKWASLVYRLTAWTSHRIERKSVASDIEGRIKSFSKRINSSAKVVAIPHEPKIEWVEETSRDAFLSGNEIIVKMDYHKNQDKNFVNAAIAYTPKALIPFSRPYVDKKIVKSIDLTVIRKLIVEEKSSAMDYFLSEILIPEVEKEPELETCYSIMQAIDGNGLFDTVLLHEFSELGRKMNLGPTNQKVIKESKAFVELLNGIATKEPGKDVNLELEGDTIRNSFVLIGRPEKVGVLGSGPYVGHVVMRCLPRHIHTVYILGTGFRNIKVGRDVVKFLKMAKKVERLTEFIRRLPFYKGRRVESICFRIELK